MISVAARSSAGWVVPGFWLTWSRRQPLTAPSSPIRRRPAASKTRPVSDDLIAIQQPVGGHLDKWMWVALSEKPYRELQGKAMSDSGRPNTESLGAFDRVNAFLEDVATVNELPTAAAAIEVLGAVEIAHRLGLPVAVVDSVVNILL